MRTIFPHHAWPTRLFTAAIFVVAGSMPCVAREANAQPEGIRHVQTITTPKALPDRTIAFADKGRQTTTASTQGLHAYDVQRGTLLHTWHGSFRALAVSADGMTLAAITTMQEVQRLWATVWDVKTGKDVGVKFSLTKYVHAAALSADGKTFATAKS